MSQASAVVVRRVGLVTLPALMQRVQTFIRLVELPTWTRIRWIFGFQRRFVRRWEWLRLMPNIGFLSQTSQTAAIFVLSLVLLLGSRGRSFRSALRTVAQRRPEVANPLWKPHGRRNCRPAMIAGVT